ncbi:MAG: hypothetical protein IJT02_03375 [Synergistaceae bacterium]|nr:hypothetical protein [Synergistaceae bacterium]
MRCSRMILCLCAVMMTAGCSFAASAYDDALGERMLRLSEIRKQTAEIELNREKFQQEEDAQYDREYESYEAEIERLRAQVEELEERIDALERSRDMMPPAGDESYAGHETRLEALASEEEEILDLLGESSDIQAENIRPFNKNATSQVIGWELLEDEETDIQSLRLTILHNRKSNKVTVIEVASDLTDNNEVYFSVKSLPAGLQVVVPSEDGSTWRVEADGRAGNKSFNSKKGYFVAKINTVEDIANSEISGESRTEGGKKIFTSGEGFIILRQSGITIKMPD